MANFNKALDYVKTGTYSTICYEGISRKFFPKWVGWKFIDDGFTDYDKLDKMVDDFYYTYFWIKLKLDDVQDQNLANLILYFAVQNGKKKAVQKVQRVLKLPQGGLMTEELVGSINSINFLELYCEYIEFCISYNKKKELELLLTIYNRYLELGGA